jgi:hypothetical protein
MVRRVLSVEPMASSMGMLMALQSSLGLQRPEAYRDVEWIKSTWYGNDWITLVAAVPLLAVGVLRARRGSVRGRLVVLGISAYAIYNYAFYLFGAALNAFFPLYAACLLLGVVTLGSAVSRLDFTRLASVFAAWTPVRLIGGYLVGVATGLTVVWLGMWGAYAFAGRPTPIDPEAFKVVAALDLCLMVPALACGGVMLWKRRPAGYLIATVAAIQGALYLLVLSVNTAIAISRGLVAAPGELPIWAPLALFTTVAAVVLVCSASGTGADDHAMPSPAR